MTITGVSHVSLAVRELGRALAFYVDVLGARLRARWARGAYLELGALWLCLELDARAGAPAGDSHIALSVGAAEFSAIAERVRASGATLWKENRSEGASLYFLDEDGHKLELHVGDLRSRLLACRAQPYDDMRFYDEGAASSGE
jgi:catechol 2,3-dioxygenase-like lactoylglutathione lyase family enzyme